jgi:hypothetical protein
MLRAWRHRHFPFKVTLLLQTTLSPRSRHHSCQQSNLENNSAFSASVAVSQNFEIIDSHSLYDSVAVPERMLLSAHNDEPQHGNPSMASAVQARSSQGRMHLPRASFIYQQHLELSIFDSPTQTNPTKPQTTLDTRTTRYKLLIRTHLFSNSP